MYPFIFRTHQTQVMGIKNSRYSINRLSYQQKNCWSNRHLINRYWDMEIYIFYVLIPVFHFYSSSSLLQLVYFVATKVTNKLALFSL